MRVVLALLVIAVRTHAETSGRQPLENRAEAAHAQQEWAGEPGLQRRDGHEEACAEFNADLAHAIVTNLTDVDCTLEVVSNATARSAFTNFEKVCSSADAEPSATRCGREGVIWKLKRLGRKYRGRRWLSQCQAGDMTAADMLALHATWAEAICLKKGNEYCFAEAGPWAQADALDGLDPQILECACTQCMDHMLKGAPHYMPEGQTPPEGAFKPNFLMAACKREAGNRFCWLDVFQNNGGGGGFLDMLKEKLGIGSGGTDGNTGNTGGMGNNGGGMDSNRGGRGNNGGGMDSNRGGMDNNGGGMDNNRGGMGNNGDNGGRGGNPGCTKPPPPAPTKRMPQDVGDALCQDNCVSGVLPAAVAFGEDGGGSADAVALANFLPLMRAGCARDRGKWCVNQFLTAGSPAKINEIASQCEIRDSATGALKAAPTVCPSGCKAALEDVGASFGCCAGSLAEFGGEMGPLVKEVATLCEVELPQQCGRPGPLRFKLLIANLLLTYAAENEEELAPLAGLDVLTALDAEGKITCDFEAMASGEGSRLSCEVNVASKDEGARVKGKLQRGMGGRRRLLQAEAVNVEFATVAAAVPASALIDADAGVQGTVDPASIVDQTDTVVGDPAATVEAGPDPKINGRLSTESAAQGLASSWATMAAAGLLALAAARR